jgi:Tol biopolymer transport system component
MLIPAAGGTPLDLTAGQGADDGPVWSPDGQRIAFNTAPPDEPLESEVAIMNRDGSGRALLTDRPGFDYGPDWSPDGSKVVFVRSEGGGELSDDEIYAINADGSGEINLSNRPASLETGPDWSGGGPGMVASRGNSAVSRWMRLRREGRLR